MDNHRAADIFKALSSSHRLLILDFIYNRNLECKKNKTGITYCDNISSCINEMVKKLNLSQSTVSHHIKELKNAGLITTEKKGTLIYCSLNYKTINTLADFLNSYKEK